MAPELTLVVFTLVLSVMDLLMPKSSSRNVLGWLSFVGLIVAGLFVCMTLNPVKSIELLHHSYRIDDFANLMKLMMLGGTALIILSSIGMVREEEIHHRGEFYYLLLPATLGGMIMASSGDLITLFVGLELLSITSYILVAMRKKSGQSNEGAFKYVVLGGISSALVLYGMSFLYGMTGSTNIAEINSILSQNIGSFASLAYISFFLLLAGFGFKISAAPFHNWAPDVYQGAPTPISTFLAVVSKAAAFAILIRVMFGVFGIGDLRDSSLHHDAFLAITVLAALAMIVGNFTALRQNNVKRMLAYSGVANSGYLLVPLGAQLAIVHFSNFTEFAFYLLAYILMNIGAFIVFMAVERASGHEEISGFAGLYYRAPFTAVAMVIFMLSLSGLPVTGGFFGKLYIILGSLAGQYYWLAAIMIGTSVVSFFYYFRVIRYMFMKSDESGKQVVIPTPLGISIWVCAIATVLLGIFPQTVTSFIESIFSLQHDLFILY
jgi:NADH-quinone oxidoreductase subunit N